jgi:hypothetical protein
MPVLKDISDVTNIQRQRVEWRRKGWTIPDLRGGKQSWFSLVKSLVELVGCDLATDLDAQPELREIPNPQSWRSYTPFLKSVGLVNNQAGTLHLSQNGIKFCSDPTKRQLADLIQDKVRLFGEVLDFLALSPATVEEVDKHFCRAYGLNWENLSNIRRRMDWLEVLELIEGIGNRKWKITAAGRAAIEDWYLVTPSALESSDSDSGDIEISEPPAEIAILLQGLTNSPETHYKRNTYNISVPSPNRIDNLRIIIQAASERITRVDFFNFIMKEFHLKESSVESMLPFLKASGLLEEVGRNIYSATAAANAWLETGNDLDFIRILHSKMRFVGEMIKAAKKDIVRNDLYAQAKPYGLNINKARWIAKFLLEAGLLVEPQYLHLKATPTGMRLASSLPLADKLVEEFEETITSQAKKETVISEHDQLTQRLVHSSCNPVAEGQASGVAFEEAIACTFRFMGFDSERIGGSGNTDVILRWKDDEGKSIVAVVDAKSKSSGKVSHSDISDMAIDTHKDKNGADFVGIIGPGFSGDTIRNHARKKEYALITVDQLSEIVCAFDSVGLSPQEIGLIFQVPNGLSQLDELIASKQRELEIISIVVSRLSREQEIIGGLSSRDLFFMSRHTSVSPSQEELLSVVETLSRPEIGVLHTTDENSSPEYTTYVLGDAKKSVNRLHALASTINNALHT